MRKPGFTLVFDTSCLSCFARADRLEALHELTRSYRAVLTVAVLEELEKGAYQHPKLAEIKSCFWLEQVHGDSLRELNAFSEYARIIGSGSRDIGEAATLAWAEVHGAIAVLDDQTAVAVARQRGVQVKRTLALICTGIQKSQLTQDQAVALVDELIAGGARFPCDGKQFILWARENGLILAGSP